jgi:hypothetical protein
VAWTNLHALHACTKMRPLGPSYHLSMFPLLLQKLSRKLVHITTGPIFILTWLFFRYELKTN